MQQPFFLLNQLLDGSLATGEVLLLLSGDVEPTGGGTPRWWDGVSGPAPTTVTTPTGVHSRAWSAAGSNGVVIALPTSTLTPSACYRFYRTADPGGTSLLFRFTGGATDIHLQVLYVSGGNFRVMRDATQLAISTGGHITLNTQFYIELLAVIANSPNGSFTCNLYDDSGNLLETLSGSGIDTQDGVSPVEGVTIAQDPGFWEDFWLDLDGQSYGPCQVEITPPNGAGDLTQIATRTGTDSGANWSQVDEIPLVSSAVDAVQATGDQTDTYVFPAGSVAGTVITAGVQAACIAASGTVNFNFVCRIGGVTYEHPRTRTMTTSVKMFGDYWRNNPATNAPWTAAERNAAQFGIHIHATNGAVRGLYRATLVQL